MSKAKTAEEKAKTASSVVPHMRNGYHLTNPGKLDRAIYGTVHRNGLPEGGVTEDASDLEVLAEYDRLGGLIQKDGRNVKMGSFYDFQKKLPRAHPEVFFVFRNLAGQEVEIAEGEAIPMEVQAAEKMQEDARKAPVKSKADDEDEE